MLETGTLFNANSLRRPGRARSAGPGRGALLPPQRRETGKATGWSDELGEAIVHKIRDDYLRSRYNDPLVVGPKLGKQGRRKGITVPWVL
jgi:hypothetical protein